MLRSVALAGALIVSASCNRSEGGETAGAPVAAAGSNKPVGSGGSFSADLAKELGVAKADGSGGKPADPAAAGDGKPAATSAGGDAKSGDGRPGAASAGGTDATKSGDAKLGDGKAGAASAGGTDATKSGDGKPGAAMKAGDAKAGDTKPGDGKAGTASAGGTDATKPGDGKPGAVTKVGDGKAGDGKAGTASAGGTDATKSGDGKAGDAKLTGNAAAKASTPAAEPRIAAPGAQGPIKVPGDLAAIKLSLLPNWDRDLDEAGTFQYVVRIKGTQSTKTFSFHYGYEDPKAPPDRDQYKKYLQDTRAMTGEIKDRQRGAAWFLEGSDASGMPAFRYVVLYGGKRLICYGSLYKDAESSRLGDDRDQTLIQAKQICETLAL